MRVLIVGKYPPLQGGVSAQTYWTARALGNRGYDVDVVTNATEAPPGLRAPLDDDVEQWSSGSVGRGHVRVHLTEGLARHSYLPWANPFASKLFGRALEAIGPHGCDGILGWYFEPFGLVAAMAGMATGSPVVLRHAGSDLGRLSHHRDLRVSYSWMLGQAKAVLTGSRGSSEARTRLESLAPAGTRFVPLARSRLPSVFSPTAPPLDVSGVLERAAEWFGASPLPKPLIEQINRANRKSIDSASPTVGVYGKVGEVKGTYDLLAALDSLARKDIAFNFLAVACGPTGRLTEFYEAVMRLELVAKRTLLLPPLAPWVVPRFLARCDLVCALERQFPIKFHTPVVPREVLASGACLVVSRELAEKQLVRDSLIDLKNCVIIDDPRDRAKLAERLELLLTDRQRARVIGKHGFYLSQALEDELEIEDATADLVDSFVRQWAG
jgi:glycosyltransferase involved in cell wall biosynthesis